MNSRKTSAPFSTTSPTSTSTPLVYPGTKSKMTSSSSSKKTILFGSGPMSKVRVGLSRKQHGSIFQLYLSCRLWYLFFYFSQRRQKYDRAQNYDAAQLSHGRAPVRPPLQPIVYQCPYTAYEIVNQGTLLANGTITIRKNSSNEEMLRLSFQSLKNLWSQGSRRNISQAYR